MTDEKREELGRLSYDELTDRHVEMQEAGGTGDEGEVPHNGHFICRCPVSREIIERRDAHSDGAPGVAPMLSRAQVRAVLGPLLADTSGRHRRSSSDAIHAAARALLNLPPHARSPLEDE